MRFDLNKPTNEPWAHKTKYKKTKSNNTNNHSQNTKSLYKKLVNKQPTMCSNLVYKQFKTP